MIDVTEIMVAVIGLLGIIITSVVVPLIKQKLTSEQWNNIKNWTSAAVEAAEVLFIGTGLGSDKRDFVLNYIESKCKENNITYDEQTIRIALENEWKAMSERSVK